MYFMAIWSILWPFGIFYGHLVYIFPVLVCCTKENLATLVFRQCTHRRVESLDLHLDVVDDRLAGLDGAVASAEGLAPINDGTAA
jgi:hypothetical protein